MDQGKKNTGKSFENLTHRVFELLSMDDAYAKVEQDVFIDSPDGPRQFDVVIRSKVGSLNLLTVIECRDFAKNLNVTHIDGLHSKQCDVNANKAVLVARKGFSKTAKQKAERVGITLCTAHDLERGLKNIGVKFPVTVMDVQRVELKPQFKAFLEPGTTVHKNAILHINDMSLIEAFQKAMRNGDIRQESLDEWYIWKPLLINDSHGYIRDIRWAQDRNRSF